MGSLPTEGGIGGSKVGVCLPKSEVSQVCMRGMILVCSLYSIVDYFLAHMSMLIACSQKFVYFMMFLVCKQVMTMV